MRSCHRCGTPWTESWEPGFNNTCQRCGIALHACANCRHYVSRGAVRCMLPEAPRIRDPQAANDCRLFEFLQSSVSAEGGGAGGTAGEREDGGHSARERWRRLFRED